MDILVLVVEDDENSRALQKAMLRSQGYKVLCAANGKEALPLLRDNVPHLIVSDILMPEMDGYALCRYCKEDERLADIPFVFYTATYTEAQDERHALDIGAARFIVKPMEVTDFLNEIRMVLEQYHDEEMKRPSSPQKTNSELNKDYSSILGRKLDRKVEQLTEERKRVEQSEKQYRQLVELAPIGIMRTTAEGGLMGANKCMARILGYESVEAMMGRIGNVARDLFADPEDRKNLLAHLAGSDQVVDQECTFKRADGGHMCVEISARALRDESGAVAGYEDFVSDITDRKRAESALVSAREQAEAANQAKSVFLANMSHEIRTPLHGMMGMLHLMKASRLDKDQAEYTDIAMDSCRRLSGLLSDILDLSVIESGKLTLKNERFSLRDVFASVENMFRVAAREAGDELRVEIDPRIPAQMLGDTTRLRQILFNLIGNSIKYTESGRVSLEAWLMPTDSPDSFRVLFIISDTGIGIPDDSLDQVFDKFAQVEQTYTRQYQGAGLGLAIVRDVVRLMKGNLAVAGEQGKGTDMYVSLPFSAAPPLESPECGHVAKPGAGTMDPKRILVVEDDRVNLDAMCRILVGLGHAVLGAEDGREALDVLRREEADLVLMDIQMPVMDGITAAQAIRQGEAGEDKKDIPIIALTAYAMSSDKEKFLAAGMDEYLAKPVELDDLRAALARLAH